MRYQLVNKIHGAAALLVGCVVMYRYGGCRGAEIPCVLDDAQCADCGALLNSRWRGTSARFQD